MGSIKLLGSYHGRFLKLLEIAADSRISLNTVLSLGGQQNCTRHLEDASSVVEGPLTTISQSSILGVMIRC